MTKIVGLVALSLIMQSAPPAFALAKCPGTPHTFHMISTNKAATCTLAKLYETQDFCLADSNGNDIVGAPFVVNPGKSVGFGLSVGDSGDFNMEYALTCVVNDGGFAKSPKSIFAIGADGPAEPAISAVNLYGAQGTWVETNDGETYTLVF